VCSRLERCAWAGKHPADSTSTESFSKLSHLRPCHCQPRPSFLVIQVSLSEVEELKALAGLAPVFLCVCIWQMCYDPIFSLLPYPGESKQWVLTALFAKAPPGVCLSADPLLSMQPRHLLAMPACVLHHPVVP
jgi:hypothetical protein